MPGIASPPDAWVSRLMHAIAGNDHPNIARALADDDTVGRESNKLAIAFASMLDFCGASTDTLAYCAACCAPKLAAATSPGCIRSYLYGLECSVWCASIIADRPHFIELYLLPHVTASNPKFGGAILALLHTAITRHASAVLAAILNHYNKLTYMTQLTCPAAGVTIYRLNVIHEAILSGCVEIVETCAAFVRRVTGAAAATKILLRPTPRAGGGFSPMHLAIRQANPAVVDVVRGWYPSFAAALSVCDAKGHAPLAYGVGHASALEGADYMTFDREGKRCAAGAGTDVSTYDTDPYECFNPSVRHVMELSAHELVYITEALVDVVQSRPAARSDLGAQYIISKYPATLDAPAVRAALMALVTRDATKTKRFQRTLKAAAQEIDELDAAMEEAAEAAGGSKRKLDARVDAAAEEHARASKRPRCS